MTPYDAIIFFEKMTTLTGHPCIVVWGPPTYSMKALWVPETEKLEAPSLLDLAIMTKALYNRLASKWVGPGKETL